MDTPNSPENEIEEITWQDDENRVTLFLRSVFVVLSGALILSAGLNVSFNSLWLTITYFLLMSVGFPVCIIWLFFGQGLRPVEWLSDQKYNAWNYGVNFRDMKSQLRWLAPLWGIGAAEIFILNKTLFHNSTQFHLGEWLGIVLLLWVLEIFLVWFVWGFLWFGYAQGLGPIAATVVIIATVGFVFVQGTDQQSSALLALAYFIPYILLCGYVCWKHKSWIPILYAAVLLTPIIPLILMI